MPDNIPQPMRMADFYGIGLRRARTADAAKAKPDSKHPDRMVKDGEVVRVNMLLMDNAGNPKVTIEQAHPDQISVGQTVGAVYDAQRTQDRADGVITCADAASLMADAVRGLPQEVAQPIIRTCISKAIARANNARSQTPSHAAMVERLNNGYLQKHPATAPVFVAAQRSSADAHAAMVERAQNAWMKGGRP
jgi:hypothetical protein